MAQPLLNDLGVLEREQGQTMAVMKAKEEHGQGCSHTVISKGGDQALIGFCIGDAGYFANLGDPPATM